MPTHKVILMTNHAPRVEASDRGTWRRLSLVGMQHNFDSDPEKKGDKAVEAMFAKELPGILNWLLDGWRRYKAEGLVVPAQVAFETHEYRKDNDELLTWLGEVFVMDKDGKVELETVWSYYSRKNIEWAKIKTAKQMSKELKQRGYVVRASTGCRTFVFGISERKEFS